MLTLHIYTCDSVHVCIFYNPSERKENVRPLTISNFMIINNQKENWFNTLLVEIIYIFRLLHIIHVYTGYHLDAIYIVHTL